MNILDKLNYKIVARIIKQSYYKISSHSFWADTREQLKIDMFCRYHLSYTPNNSVEIFDFNNEMFVPFFTQPSKNYIQNVKFKKCDLLNICFMMESEIATSNLIFVNCKIGLYTLRMGRECVTKVVIVDSYVHVEFDDFVREVTFKYHNLKKIIVINSHFGESLISNYTWTNNKQYELLF